jgi:hypothetical protein
MICCRKKVLPVEFPALPMSPASHEALPHPSIDLLIIYR